MALHQMIDNQKIWTFLGIVVVISLTLTLYWPGLSGPFVLDDRTNIVNAYIDNPDWDAVFYTLTHNGSGLLGRSVSAFSFILTGLQYGVDPWGYKLHNLILHLINGLLLFRLLYFTLHLLQPFAQANRILLVSAITSAFWLLHPLLVSTVLYAVQRMAELAVFFILLALLAYLQARSSAPGNRKFYVYGWVLFPSCVLMSVFSKEIGVLIPLYVLVYELLVFHNTPKTFLHSNRHLQVWLTAFVLLPLLIGAAVVLVYFPEIANFDWRNFTLAERLMTQLHVVVHYVQLIVLPKVSDMSLFQDDFPLTTTFDLSTALLLGLLLVVVTGIWFLRVRVSVLAFGLAIFLVSHLLESTFLPLELVFEHRNYLAAVGLLLPLVHYVLQAPIHVLKPLCWLLGVYLGVVVLLTYSRVQEWGSQDMLMTIAITEHPDSPRARTEYANYLFNNGRSEEGLDQLLTLMELEPRDAGVVLHLLFYKCIQGIRDEALLERAEMLLGNWPASVYVLNGLDNLQAQHNSGGCTVITTADIGRLVSAAEAFPDNRSNATVYGYLLRFQGVQAFNELQYVAGVVAMRRAHEVSGLVSVLGELMRFQIAFNQLGDAGDTLDYIEELNEQSYGSENHLVRELSRQLSDATKVLPEKEFQ